MVCFFRFVPACKQLLGCAYTALESRDSPMHCPVKSVSKGCNSFFCSRQKHDNTISQANSVGDTTAGTSNRDASSSPDRKVGPIIDGCVAFHQLCDPRGTFFDDWEPPDLDSPGSPRHRNLSSSSISYLCRSYDSVGNYCQRRRHARTT